jgi:hypothetical protein
MGERTKSNSRCRPVVRGLGVPGRDRVDGRPPSRCQDGAGARVPGGVQLVVQLRACAAVPAACWCGAGAAW